MRLPRGTFSSPTMSQSLLALRFPGERYLLPRTKLAYVHLPRLLSDAKRDRSARVSGFVGIWLPDCIDLLFLTGGELANAAVVDGRGRRAIPIAEALARVPSEPEWGEIEFCEAPHELLACMYHSFAVAGRSPAEASSSADPAEFFPHLLQEKFSGFVEATVDSRANYLIFEEGKAVRGYFSGSEPQPLPERMARAWARGRESALQLRLFELSDTLPQQALPSLVNAYRELSDNLVAELVVRGRDSAPALAEHARAKLLELHPTLSAFAPRDQVRTDPVCTADELTGAVAAWVAEMVWTGLNLESGAPEELLQSVTRERRHMLQSAGFFERLPWKMEW